MAPPRPRALWGETMSTIIPAAGPPGSSPNVAGEISVTGTLAIGAGATYYSAGPNIRLFWSDHNSVPYFYNAGMIWNASTSNVSAGVVGFYIFNVQNSGTIGASSNDGNAYGVGVEGIGITVDERRNLCADQGGQCDRARELRHRRAHLERGNDRRAGAGGRLGGGRRCRRRRGL